MSVSYCMVCNVTSVREENTRALARTDAKPHNNLLVEPACICTLCIARYLALNIEILIKCALSVSNYMVCKPVGEDNLRALVSEFSPVQTQKPYNYL